MDAPTLSSRERARLRSEAHHLKPIQHIGMAGVTPAVLRSVEEGFNTRELLKVKVLEGAPASPYETGDRIAEGLPGVQVVQTIGRTLVLYRPLPEEPDA